MMDRIDRLWKKCHDETSKERGFLRLNELETLFREHSARIYRLAYRYFGSVEEAEDVMQEAFVRVMENREGFRAEADIATWLYRIAVNVCLDKLRSHKRMKQMPVDMLVNYGSGNNPYDSMERNELAKRVRQEIDRLEPKQKILIVLRDLEELSYEEIGRITGLSIGTISSRLNRARRRIFHRLANGAKGEKP